MTPRVPLDVCRLTYTLQGPNVLSLRRVMEHSDVWTLELTTRPVFATSESTSSTEHRCAWEAASTSTGQEMSRVLWNPKVRYRIHNRPPRAPVLSHMNPFHVFPYYFMKITLMFTPIYAWVFQVFFSFRFPCQNPVCIFALLVVFFIFNEIILAVPCKVWGSSLCRFLFSPPSSPLLSWSQYHPQHPILSLCFFLSVTDQVSLSF
jgi:hypothetical protein